MDRTGLVNKAVGVVLDREFLELRARLLEVAAGLDRLGRAPGSIQGDSRYGQIQQALALLGSAENDRAEKLQLIFSLAYDPDWRRSFSLDRAADAGSAG